MTSLPAKIAIFFLAPLIFCADALCALAGFEKSSKSIFAANLDGSNDCAYPAAVNALFDAFEN